MSHANGLPTDRPLLSMPDLPPLHVAAPAGCSPGVIEAEQCLLACMLIDPDLLALYAPRLSPADFHRIQHGAMLRVLQRLRAAGVDGNIVTLHASLDAAGWAAVGGVDYVLALHNALPHCRHHVAYAKQVSEASRLRGLAAAAAEVSALCLDPQASADSVQARASELLARTAAMAGDDATATGAEVVESLTARITERAEGGAWGLPTGLRDLDALTGGLKPKGLYYVGARPSMGKSSLCTTIIGLLLLRGVPCLLATIEMSNEEAVTRIICSQAGVDQRGVESGRMTDAEWRRFRLAADAVAASPLTTCEATGLTPSRLRGLCRRVQGRHGSVGLVCVDYVQLMRADRPSGHPVQDFTEISQQMKAIAKEFSAPVLAVVSLNRAVESRENKRPELSDIRECGQFESDGDLVAFLYNEARYAPPGAAPCDPEAAQRTELIVRKHRNGPVGTVNLGFIGPYTLFTDWDEAPAPDGPTGF